MDEMKRKESGASEVIGAVLLVSLVVIGGAVVAAMVFGQPTPKEVPHVSFGVIKNNTAEELTLHHTGGDSLRWDEYGVIVYPVGSTEGIDVTMNVTDKVNPWSADGDMKIRNVTYPVGSVVLTYKDQSAGETALRKVDFEDNRPQPVHGTISGTKWDVTVGKVAMNGVTINIYRKVGSSYHPVYTNTTGADGIPGHYFYKLPLDQWGVYKVEEVVPAGMEPVMPPQGWRNVEVTEDNPDKIQDFENRRVPPPISNPDVTIAKVTSDGTNEGDGQTIDEFTPITWKYTITNTGDVALNNIQVTDDHNGVTPVYQSGDTNNDGYLNLTETWIYTATGTAVEGGYSNTGTVTGTPPTGHTVTASDVSSYTGTAVVPVPVTISGQKQRVDEAGTVVGPVGGILIRLTLVEPQSLLPLLVQDYDFSNKGEKEIPTGTDGSYSFTVPDVPATYSLSEIGIDPKTWFIQYPPAGIYPTVTPEATGMNFQNYQIPGDGNVMYLNKTVQPGCPGGHVADGTTLEGEANKNDFVWINGHKYTFSSGEQFRFTIWGDQDTGEVKIEHFEMTSLTFNVKFEVKPNKASPSWSTPDKMGVDPSTGQSVIGKPTKVSIDAINKNLLNEDSTLEYHFPSVCSATDTLLRLNGKVVIPNYPSPPNDKELLFTDLHEVHDNRYGEGLNTMWIYLLPGYDYILAQGVCVYP